MPASPRKSGGGQKEELKLYYFKGPGRPEPIRLAFEIGGIPYEYVGLDREEFNKLKDGGKFPYDQVPYLEINGQGIAQSMAILRYAGKRTKLYPEDPLKAAKVDEVIDFDVDVANAVINVIWGESNEEVKAAKLKTLKEETFPAFLKKLSAVLERNDTGYAVGDTLTIADLKLVSLHRHIIQGSFAPLTGEAYDNFPTIKEYIKRLESHPKIKAYIDREEKKPEQLEKKREEEAGKKVTEGSPRSSKKPRVDGGESPTKKKNT